MACGGVLSLGDEVLGEQQHVAPVLLDEFATCFVDIDVLHGVPLHAVEVVEERCGGHAVAGVGHEAVGVAFELQASGVELAEMVVGVVGEVDGTGQLYTFFEELGKALATHKADILDADVEAHAFNCLQVPEGEGVVVAVGEEDGALRVPVA